MSKAKKNVLFIGSFKEYSKDGSVGGQMFASKSIINSNLSESINWVLIDSTADSNKIENILKRSKNALIRCIYFIKHLIFSKIDTVLIFTADGWSFLEKGTMSLIAKFVNKKVILAPRSGLVINDVNNSNFFRYFIPFVIRKVDHIICQGVTWKYFYLNLSKENPDKFIVIQNWIDTSLYYRHKKYNSKTINILYLSWVDHNKGILDLIMAASLLNTNNIIINIAGDGQAMQESKNLVEKYNLKHIIKFLGWVLGDNKIDLLSTSDIYVLPSYFEGFPNSLMEAMISKCAIISTNVGSIPDLIQHAENGLLYNPGDINKLKEHLDALISNIELRKKLSHNAFETIINNNSIDFAVQKLKTIL